MPERLRKQVLGGLSRGWLLGCAASLAAVPGLAAESLPASVRACAAVTDSLQRLVCYDREVAKFPAPAAKTEKSAPGAQPAQSGRAEAPAGRADAGGRSQGTGAAVASGGASGVGAASTSGGSAGVTSGFAVATTPGAQGPTAVTSTPAAAGTPGAQGGTNNPAGPANDAQSGAGSSAAATKPNSTSVAIAAGDEHVRARIVGIDRQPNEMILHLDNGQVWQEVQSVSGDLSLREGDAVKIDRHLGSFWLTGPHVSSMKVQRKS